MSALSCLARSSSRTVKANLSATVPGSVTMAISPSQVLQIHPLRENFCRKPARSPSEYDQCRVNQVKPTSPRTTAIRKPMNILSMVGCSCWTPSRATAQAQHTAAVGALRELGLEACPNDLVARPRPCLRLCAWHGGHRRRYCSGEQRHEHRIADRF